MSILSLDLLKMLFYISLSMFLAIVCKLEEVKELRAMIITLCAARPKYMAIKWREAFRQLSDTEESIITGKLAPRLTISELIKLPHDKIEGLQQFLALLSLRNCHL